MRCPKCSYISFDKVTSCKQCSTDVTEVAQSLNGTAFKPLGTFYLGTLIPDYAASFLTDEVVQDYGFDSGADDLAISMDDAADFGAVPDLPGDIDTDELSLATEDLAGFEGDELSLDGHEVPDMDLSDFGRDSTGFVAGKAPVEQVEDVGLEDVPDFDLANFDMEDEIDVAADDLDAAPAGPVTPDLSEIDLSLGDNDFDLDMEMEAAADEDLLDLGNLEMEEKKEKDSGQEELPDLEL